MGDFFQNKLLVVTVRFDSAPFELGVRNGKEVVFLSDDPDKRLIIGNYGSRGLIHRRTPVGSIVTFAIASMPLFLGRLLF